jgi:antitoxin CptB
LPAIRVNNAFDIEETTPLMAPSKDAGEDLSMRRRRLRYRAWHRGTREMDLVLGPFADSRLEGMDAPTLDRLETLMDEQDADLLTWVMGQVPTPGHIDAGLISEMADHCRKRHHG